jgi:hypothetical protein
MVGLEAAEDKVGRQCRDVARELISAFAVVVNHRVRRAGVTATAQGPLTQ